MTPIIGTEEYKYLDLKNPKEEIKIHRNPWQI
jgi:hypothetical protein